ncbi:MAG TPA: spore protease YyaC [Limnochordia bacterium]|nr:spore protease YyaC [Limnochordia bacterium]HKM42860.1 spore protease YyaC [Limnochordia bacterium]
MFFESDIVGRTHFGDPLSSANLAVTLASLQLKPYVDIVCVGTDRSTGDALGPFIGSALVKRQEEGLLPSSVAVHGTIHHPVHALNLDETIGRINQDGRESTIIAIDACLGRVKSIGYISVKKGPLHPGTGVSKQLPTVGHYHIIGVVNVAGFMEHVVLQNTRLSLVMQMADVITEALTMCLANHLSAVEAAPGSWQTV